MISSSNIVITAAKRTPIGAFQGQFAGVRAVELGAAAVHAAVAQAGVAPEQVDELILGCVLPAGQGQAPARQVALAAGLPQATACSTLNKVCGSGMKAVMLAHDMIRAGSAQIIVAGGMESMSRAPHLIEARAGIRYGNASLIDHMAWDGLSNAYDGKAMGEFGELCAAHYQFERRQQDAYALESVRRAQATQAAGAFAEEIVPVSVSTRKGAQIVDADEGPRLAQPEKIPQLKPAFLREGGTITAASSSSISDGAAALVLASSDSARQQGLLPLARIVAHASHSQAPEWFTTAPVGAIRQLLARIGWRTEDVDLYEINEAFAVVTMAAIQELDLDPAQVNVEGGACALGHPIGASGARILVTLLYALRRRGLKRGVAALCIGGGEATAIAIELMDGV
ncbi:acetyl- acetyltransferase [Lasius niger]|uniref:Acetyl-acetyltransferase n=1 Tax=Lasius niger TaxID=67767 RepID=A0A0J7K014_LASNI|nr:acetyl- acetyltransferase [Lasius niger]